MLAARGDAGASRRAAVIGRSVRLDDDDILRSTRFFRSLLEELRRAASTLGVILTLQMIRPPEDVDPALTSLARERLDALYVTTGPVNSAAPGSISQFREIPVAEHH